MRFTFKYSNDFGETAEGCCRCGELTRERCVFAFSGVRITLWACRSCRYLISSMLTIFGEWFLRAVFAARDAQEAGKAVAEYQNAFSFDWNGNGVPLTKNRTQKKRQL